MIQGNPFWMFRDVCPMCIVSNAVRERPSYTLRIGPVKVRLCKKHARVVYLAFEREFGKTQTKEMPWADEIAAEKERSKWWK